jgi:hypothetical protein
MATSVLAQAMVASVSALETGQHILEGKSITNLLA